MPAILAIAYHRWSARAGRSAAHLPASAAAQVADRCRTSRGTAASRRRLRCAASDDVELDRQIVGEEIGRIGVVGEDAADLGRRRNIASGCAALEPAPRVSAWSVRSSSRAIGGQDLAIFALPAAARWPSPTMPRWPATQTRLPLRSNRRAVRHAVSVARSLARIVRARDDLEIVVDHFAHQLLRTSSRASSRASCAP